MFDDPNVVLHCEKIDKIYPGTKALPALNSLPTGKCTWVDRKFISKIPTQPGNMG